MPVPVPVPILVSLQTQRSSRLKTSSTLYQGTAFCALFSI